MKVKLHEYGNRLLSDKYNLRCDSVPSDSQTCALRSHYEGGGSRYVRNAATRMVMMKAAAY